jgi:hypothetical protein
MPLDPLELLSRPDKWFLANGRGAMFAPPFPRYLDRLGFWDEAYLADLRFERLFTVLVLDERFRPIPMRLESRDWRPDRLRQTWSAEGLDIAEDKVVVGEEVFASKITLVNRSTEARALNLVLWSLQACLERSEQDQQGLRKGSDEPALTEVTFEAACIRWRRRFADGDGSHFVQIALGADRAPTSHTINLCERAAPEPLWEVSAITDQVRDGLLAGEDKVRVGAEPWGQLHLALHYRVALAPGASETLTFGAGLACDEDTAARALEAALSQDVSEASEQSWRRFFESVPAFECSDPYLTTYYWYRWYGLRLLMVALCRGNLPYPCIFEGIGGFRKHISYSAQCHMRETAWMGFASVAEGSLLNFVHNPLENGSFAGHIGLWSHDQGFYHADWGGCALEVYDLFRDKGFLKAIYPALVRYADYFARERDPEGQHLYDVINQGETGQEYASRYLFADPRADQWVPIRLKGVDATVYIYRLQRALARMAEIIERPEEARRWTAEADATKTAVRERMWDPERRIFVDVLPTGERSPYLASTAFYPFMTDIAGPGHLAAITGHLLNPDEFWTEFPVPTVPLTDPHFNADAQWKGKRMSCPWSGRVWPMTNSHACEALAHAAQTLDPALAPRAAELISRFIRMMFLDGDARRPNCFEHYNPHTGMPCLYRGVDDYQHSWAVDLIIRYVAGVQPQPGGSLVVHPLPFGLEHFTLDRLHCRGHALRVTWRAAGADAGLRVWVDGTLRAQSKTIARLELPIAD